MSTEDLDVLLARIPDSGAPAEACIDDARLIAYRKGAADQAEVSSIEAHLAACRECRDLLGEYAAPVPEHLVALIDPEALTRKARVVARRRVSAVVSTLALAAGIGFLLTRPRGGGDVLVEYAAPFCLIDGCGMAADRGAERQRGPSAPNPSLAGKARLFRSASGSVDASVTRPRIYLPYAQLRIGLKPIEQPAQPKEQQKPLPRAFLFVSGPDHRLHPAPQGPKPNPDGVFTLDQPARALFGDKYGPSAVHFLLLPAKASNPPDLTGLEVGEARRRMGAHRWFTYELEYLENMPSVEGG